MPTRRNDVVLLGEFAKAAGISRMTAYVRARSGEIPAVFRGGRYEIRRRDLPRILRRCARRSTRGGAR